MKLPRRTFLHLAAGAAAVPAVSRIAKAQSFPSRPITMIVPFAAGGLTDVIGRILAEGMRTSLGQLGQIHDLWNGLPLWTGAAGSKTLRFARKHLLTKWRFL
jgi:hypothetical protein